MSTKKIFLVVFFMSLCSIALELSICRAQTAGSAEPTYLLPKDGAALLKLSVAELELAVKTIEKSVSGYSWKKDCQQCTKVTKAEILDAKDKKDLLMAKHHTLDQIRNLIQFKRQQISSLYRRISQLREQITLKQMQQKKPAAPVAESVRIGRQHDQKEFAGALRQLMLGFAPADLAAKGIPDLQERQDNINSGLKTLNAEFGKPVDVSTSDLNILNAQISLTWQNIDDLEYVFFTLINMQDENGYTLLAQALVYDDDELVDKLMQYEYDYPHEIPVQTYEAMGTLKRALISAISRQNLSQAERLLAKGADVGGISGKYSPLALAEIFGQARTIALLRGVGAEVQVPWDPLRTESYTARMNALEKHEDRVRAFLMSTPLESKDRVAWQEYVDSLCCRIDCLKRKMRFGTRAAL